MAVQMEKFLASLRVQLRESHLVQNSEMREFLIMEYQLGM